jgi:hypothetical protein
MSLAEISDRLEIAELFSTYSHAVDSRDWTLYRSLFSEGAYIDYTAFGGPAGRPDDVVAHLSQSLLRYPVTQHANANLLITFTGEDTASVRSICYNPVVRETDGRRSTTVYGLWYRDELVRTDEGWRISRRSEDAAYVLHDLP